MIYTFPQPCEQNRCLRGGGGGRVGVGGGILLFCKHTVKDDKFVLLFAVYAKDKAGALLPRR